MILFKKALDLVKYIDNQKKAGKTIGFVPTMGALHQGHLALLTTCKKFSDISVCSIFVNPTQFNNPTDFQKYPVTISEDILKLEVANCSVLFLPSINEIYPPATMKAHYELGYLETILEGQFRPGHFQGVSQVVHKLLDIVKPDKLFLGQKDYQQCMVIKKVIALMQIPISVFIQETVREPSGLAMSSRNLRLNEEDKKNAAAIYQCLISIKKDVGKDSIPQLTKTASEYLLANGFSKIDYVVIAKAGTLQVMDEWDYKTPAVLLIAAYLGEVRLIDNLILDPFTS